MSELAWRRPPLSDRVDFFWAFDAYGGAHARERVLPTATSELVVALSNDRSHPVICGAHSESFVIDTASRPALIGVHFKPGSAVPFLKMPANELCNARVSLDALWGGAAPELRERLLEARTWPARFRVLERALLAQLTGPTRRHPAVAFALSAIQAVPHARTIGQLTERIGLSSRRFIEVFSAEVGLTPKLFCRVHRFQRVLAMIERDEDIDWIDRPIDGEPGRRRERREHARLHGRPAALGARVPRALRGGGVHAHAPRPDAAASDEGDRGGASIGGNDGYPHLRACLLDLPEVIEVAGRHAAAVDERVRARLSFVAGDMFADVPAADTYVVKTVMHDWDDASCGRRRHRRDPHMTTPAPDLCGGVTRGR